MDVSPLVAILLGLVQGLTEFLPVSSSGHLILVQALLGVEGNLLLFDVFVHIGTLVAVFVVFWQDIWAILRRPLQKLTGLIIVACIPAGLMGLLLDDLFEKLFSSVIVVAIALVITGVLLLVSDRFRGQKNLTNMKYTDALLIGISQGIAITPGLSRSGTTIFGALLCGLRREDAAKFSFLISIPVILGAGLKEGLSMVSSGIEVFEWTYVVGALVAAVSGYVAIRFFIRLLQKGSLRYFSYYVWILAAIVLISRIF